MTPSELDDLIVAAARFIEKKGGLDSALDEVADLRENKKNFASAADSQQQKVVGPLEKYHHRIDAVPDRDPEAEAVRRQLAGKLADAYGTLGGLRRKLGDQKKSLALYTAGANLERDARNQITVAYNLTNKINLTILLHPDRIADPVLIGDVRETLARLRRRADRPDCSDFWAVADCALLALLARETALTEEYYTRLNNLTGVEGWMYGSAADMLLALSTALEPFEAGVTARMRAEADRLKRKK